MSSCINCGTEGGQFGLWDGKFCGNCVLCENCTHLTTKDYRGIFSISFLNYCDKYGYWEPHYWRCAGFSKKEQKSAGDL